MENTFGRLIDNMQRTASAPMISRRLSGKANRNLALNLANAPIDFLISSSSRGVSDVPIVFMCMIKYNALAHFNQSLVQGRS